MTMIMMAKIYIEKNMIANMKKLQRRLIVCIKKKNLFATLTPNG